MSWCDVAFCSCPAPVSMALWRCNYRSFITGRFLASIPGIAWSTESECDAGHSKLSQYIAPLSLIAKQSHNKYHQETFLIHFPMWLETHFIFTTGHKCTNMIGTVIQYIFYILITQEVVSTQFGKTCCHHIVPLWSSRMLIEACLKQMMAGHYQAQSPRIHLQCWHLKHLMFIFWRRWDNPFSERHKHSTLGTWLLALSPIQPTWLERIVVVIQDNSSPTVEHWEREDKGK